MRVGHPVVLDAVLYEARKMAVDKVQHPRSCRSSLLPACMQS